MNTTKNVYVITIVIKMSGKRVVKYTVSVKFKCVEMTVHSQS